MESFILTLVFTAISFSCLSQSLEEAIRHANLKNDQGLYDEAVFLLQKAIDNHTIASSDTLLAEAYHQLAINYFRLGNDELAIYYWYQEIDKLNDQLQIARVLRNIGKSYSFLGKFPQAKTALQESLRKHLANDRQEMALLGNTYRDLGYVYIQQEDMQRAEEHLQQAASIYQQSPEQHRRLLGELYAILFSFAHQKNALDSALYYAQLSLESFLNLTDKIPADTFDLANKYHNVGLAYQTLDSLSKAQDYYQRSLNINLSYKQNRWEALANNYNVLSIVYLQLKDFQKAEQHIYKAIAINKELAKALPLADNYNNLAEIQLSKNHLKEALASINKSIQYLVPDFISKNALENPSLHDNSAVIGDRIELAKSLADKARIITALANQADSTYFLAAVATYQTSTDLFNEIRANLGSAQSKRYFTANARDILEQAIQANLQGYEKYNQDTSYLNNILSLMELSRAVSLLDEFQFEKAKVMADIPGSLLAREETLQQEILSLENNVFEGEDSLLTTLIQKRKELEQFKQDTLEQYPIYARLKIPDLVSLNTLQQTLIQPNQAVLQYFVGDTTLYCLYADQSEAQIYSMTLKTDLPMLVAQLDSLLTVESSEVTSFRPVAHKLYEYLLKQPLTHIKDKPEIQRLLIIPDGMLSKIPFDVLPSEPANIETRFFSYPYLLRKYAIAYAYSASVLQLQKSYHGYNVYQVGAFSIKDYKNYDQLEDLSGEDAKLACDILSGNLYENSTLSSFIKQAPNYQTLHLSMHGFGNVQDALQSYLVFQDTILRAANIYAMKLPAAMIVLSGCETGKGQLQKGEGILSLAHAFAYAGASSTIMSLWKLKDYTSIELFRTFYEKIADNNIPKDVALQQAKLALYKTYPQFHHPFYWAALVSSGDQTPLEFERKWYASFFNGTNTFLGGNFWNWSIFIFVFIGICLITILKLRKSKVA